MALHYYMALQGVGRWQATMSGAGAQLAPYRNYLTTARKSAENRALSLAWHKVDADECGELNRRLQECDSREAGQKRPTRQLAGIWVRLEAPPGRAEEPEATFEKFFDAKEVCERPGNAPRHWCIGVLGADVEARALLLERLPTLPNNEESAGRETPPAQATAREAAALLFLRQDTWPLQCRIEALRELENRPAARLAPLVRLVATRANWPAIEPEVLGESDWMFLRAQHDGALRDGTQEQRTFVQLALATPDFALLEGPPGSGKTTAICELIAQAARRGQRVLLVASTHVAVDNVLERVTEWQEKSTEQLVMPVRIGDERNVTSSLAAGWTLGNMRRTWRHKIRGFLTKPHGAASSGAAAREMLSRALSEEAPNSALDRLILEASNLVCGTTIGFLQHPAIKAGRRMGSSATEPFDLLILDEASKTTLPEFLVPALYAKRWIVVGDTRQLSPYVEEQDLADNFDALLPADTSRAAVQAFLASLSGKRRRCLLVPVASGEQASLLSQEAEARDVAAVDLDRVELAPLGGVEGACAALLHADLVFGLPDTIARWQNRLPADLEPVEGVPDLPDWQAHVRALDPNREIEPVSWAAEMAWRQVRLHELLDATGDGAQRLEQEIEDLMPQVLDDETYFRNRRPRTLPDGTAQTAYDALGEDLDTIRRVAMPSVLDVLQFGAGPLSGWDEETSLTHGLPESALAQRMVSLSFQHRMHPNISAFPRQEFYEEDGLLQDAAGMRKQREWGYPRYARRAGWVDVRPRRQAGGGNVNPAEVDAVMEELHHFEKWAVTAPRTGEKEGGVWEVAVLTFYRAQEKELRRRLQRLSSQRGNSRNFQLPGPGGRVHVTLCTVDRFQGHEADLVLLSFVKSGSVGFLNSPKRMNVALTRARYQLVLVGHRQWLASERCKSGLLRRLAGSPLYPRDIHWEQQP